LGEWEPFAGLVSVVAVIITWPSWYADLVRINPLAAPRPLRIALALTPPACLLLLLLCLDKLAARAVRESSFYLLVYVALGAAVLGVSVQLFSFLGISARDDVLERSNVGALIALVGAMLGSLLCFAGGNIGEGPGVGVVLLSAGTALCVWFVLWYLVERLSGGKVSELITVDRDRGCGARLGALLLANGLILGAAAAGDWIPERFFTDFIIFAWPAFVLTVAAAVLERHNQPRASVAPSILSGSIYFVLACAWVFRTRIHA
jgi:uncharacterized membrane protein YjfL (UPF0719 family)